MLQAMSPPKIAHRTGNRFICADANQVQAQERKRFTQNRGDNCLARKNRVPLLGYLGLVRIEYRTTHFSTTN